MLRTRSGVTIPFCCAAAWCGPMDVTMMPIAAIMPADAIFADNFIILLPSCLRALALRIYRRWIPAKTADKFPHDRECAFLWLIRDFGCAALQVDRVDSEAREF